MVDTPAVDGLPEGQAPAIDVRGLVKQYGATRALDDLDLRLDSGVTVMLPDEGEAGALAELVAIDRAEGVLARDVETVDLRLSDRIAIRLSADAAKARLAALKERGVKATKERRI